MMNLRPPSIGVALQYTSWRLKMNRRSLIDIGHLEIHNAPIVPISRGRILLNSSRDVINFNNE